MSRRPALRKLSMKAVEKLNLQNIRDCLLDNDPVRIRHDLLRHCTAAEARRKDACFMVILQYLEQYCETNIKGCFYMLQIFDILLTSSFSQDANVEEVEEINSFFDNHMLLQEMALAFGKILQSKSILTYKPSHVVECFWRIYESSLNEGRYTMDLFLKPIDVNCNLFSFISHDFPFYLLSVLNFLSFVLL